MTTRTGHQSESNLERLLKGATDEVLAELVAAAYVDPLTGLLNRRALDRDLGQRLAVAKRGGRPLTIVVGDLDGLKAINDRDGHPAGDLALRTLGAALDSALRVGDTAYRIGGDEFLLLLADTAAGEADAVLARVSTQAPAFSWGGATFPEDGDDGNGLVDLADQRLLAGRRATRGHGAAAVPEKRAGRTRRTGSAFAAAAVVVTALLGGVGVGFAAENVMDARENGATLSVKGNGTTSSVPEPAGESTGPAKEAGAPGAQATTSATLAPASPQTPAIPVPVPAITLPSVPLDDAVVTVPANPSTVVEVVEELLGGPNDTEPAHQPELESRGQAGEGESHGSKKDR